MSKSKIFLLLCLSFVAGVFVASLADIKIIFLYVLLAISIFLISWRWKKNHTLIIIGLCLLFFPLGIYKYNLAVDKKHEDISFYNDKGLVKLRGIVVGEPEKRIDKTEFIIFAEINGKRGRVLIITNRFPEFQYGDELEIFGKLKTPQNYSEFDYRAYLAKDDIYSISYYPKINFLGRNNGNAVYRFLFAVKGRFEEKINNLLSEPHASFLAGLILGEKAGFSDELLEELRKTGTSHLVVLSGYNITIVASILMAIFTFFMVSRHYSFWLASGGIILFVIMVGASPSVIRAAIMGILVLLARHEGRLYNATNAIVLAGTVMIFLNPKILRFDLGFQLSFLATCGLVYLYPIFKEKFKSLPEFLGFKEALIATLSAQISVLPLILVSFGNLSLISPLTNVLILPLVPLIMFLGLSVVLIGFVFLPLAKILSWLIWLLLSWQLKVIEFSAIIPFASIKLDFFWIFLWIYYSFLIIYIRRDIRRKNPLSRGEMEI